MKGVIQSIKKRDGRVVPFHREKITNAIWQAVQAVGGRDRNRVEELSGEIWRLLNRKYEPGGVPSVEHVQDVVEKVLIEQGHAQTAKAYILYRERHKNIREVTQLLRDISMVEDYINEMDWRVRENSNMTYSLQGLNVHITQKVISNYWLNSIYSKEVREAHIKGKFHIHDLGTLGPYCVGWDLQDLLMVGFRGVRGKIESNPANHFDVALMQIVNFLYTLQGEAAGAQAFSNFDTLLAPFIRHDKLDYKEVKQSVQKFLFNMNVPTRVGFQTPFTNITLDLTVPEYLKEQPVIIGGRAGEETYGDFQAEMDLFNQAFAEVMQDGDASGRPFTFPIPTYNVTKDFPWHKIEYNAIWEMTAKYGIPYFSNFINSDLKPDDVRSMCCRLRLDKRELKMRGGGLFGSNPLTGSVGVVTINLPRIAFEADSEEEFFAILSSRMELARESLGVKRRVLEEFTDRGLYPYSKFYLRYIKESFDQYWKNHFSTIGIIGMNDALLNFQGHDISRPEGSAFAGKVMDFIRDRLADFQEETGNIFNLEATPAEGTSYRLARLDKKEYPELKIYNQQHNGNGKAAPYYTNSTQLPVGFTDDVFEALKLQDGLQSKYTGGTVMHCFLGESMPSIEATRSLVKTIAENFHLPYYTLTPTFSICEQHGYIKGEHENCPQCGSKCEVWSRSVGYLRPVDQWNRGKQEEFQDRKTFDRQLKAQTLK
ncbi:MAG TPA: ribonucleoside triphosphate reductase [Spirochaetales bacterium]|nr:ribonucleoside triphosphate reductase [Spirochaetales bacterium]